MENKYFVFYNPHPKGCNVNDCVKRAICATTGEDYMEVQRRLNRLKRELQVNDPAIDSFRNRKVTGEFVKRQGWKKIGQGDIRFIDFPEWETGAEFCDLHPKGKYILQMNRHWAACVDGKIYDTWDSTQEPVAYALVVSQGGSACCDEDRLPRHDGAPQAQIHPFWVSYNPHPKEKHVPDCVKRAICATTGEDYMEVQRSLNRLKREMQRTDPSIRSFRSRALGIEYAARRGWRKIGGIGDNRYAMRGSGWKTGAQFCEEHPVGSYILQMPEHWAGCVNGVIYDTWDSSENAVEYAFLVG